MVAVNWGMWNDVGLAGRDAADGLPILDRRIVQTRSETIFSGTLNAKRDWVLGEHRFKNGTALLPGTGYLQLAAAALAKNRVEPGIEFEDVYFLAPFAVEPNETKEVRVRLQRQGTGFRFSVLAREPGVAGICLRTDHTA